MSKTTHHQSFFLIFSALWLEYFQNPRVRCLADHCLPWMQRTGSSSTAAASATSPTRNLSWHPQLRTCQKALKLRNNSIDYPVSLYYFILFYFFSFVCLILDMNIQDWLNLNQTKNDQTKLISIKINLTKPNQTNSATRKQTNLNYFTPKMTKKITPTTKPNLFIQSQNQKTTKTK